MSTRREFGINFEMKIDEMENYINVTTELVKNSQVKKKTIQIDLDAISSGSGSSNSSDSNDEQVGTNNSQNDTELNARNSVFNLNNSQFIV